MHKLSKRENHTSRLIEQEGGLTRLLITSERGKPAWFVIKLDQQLYHHYKAALRQPVMNIRDYGQILKAGWGQPSADLVAEYTA